MKNHKMIQYILAVLILLGMGYLAIFIKDHYFEKKPTSIENKQLWTCPMHPQIIQDKPGNCPICHMELVPVKEPIKQEDSQDHSTQHSIQIKIDPSMIQKIGIRTQTAEKKQVERSISVVGHIDYDEREIYIINSRINGWVEKLFAKYNGKYIKKGEALLAIYSPELYATQEEYLNLYKQYQISKKMGNSDIANELYKTLQSAKERLKLWNISESQIQQIENQQKAQKLLYLTSPYNGFIIEKFVFEGQQV
jgi:Cu(I)/Ag(I) efflux system membrane fusion protein